MAHDLVADIQIETKFISDKFSCKQATNIIRNKSINFFSVSNRFLEDSWRSIVVLSALFPLDNFFFTSHDVKFYWEFRHPREKKNGIMQFETDPSEDLIIQIQQ